jgi:tetratricopeptide (TPR) repeat protein
MEIKINVWQLKYLYIALSFLALPSCKKYLDTKPDKKMVIPTQISDLQGLLDYYYYMNQQCSDLGGVSSDNYYLNDEDFSSLPFDRERDMYLWKPGIFLGSSPTDWQNEYTVVYNANVVLNNIRNIERNASNASAWDNCKGSALVFRAKSFYEIAQIWAKIYDSTTASTDLGIPLRLTSDFNVKSVRSSVQQTYNQIISDLKEAISLLPDKPVFSYRPSKCAAYGLLARTYLVMGNYQMAGLYADSALEINGALLDYNTLDTTSAYPFQSVEFTNPEDIMHSTCQGADGDIIPWDARIDSMLYRSYNINDLRKSIFFGPNSDSSTYYFKGNDEANGYVYNGIATDELYLIRAECNARLGHPESALDDLNTLLSNRYKTGTFIPYTTNNTNDVLSLILTERRKELVFRMLRFSDIKRLNRDGANIIQQRTINGQTYTLPPNNPRYALPIPEDVIQYTGMKQN